MSYYLFRDQKSQRRGSAKSKDYRYFCRALESMAIDVSGDNGAREDTR